MFAHNSTTKKGRRSTNIGRKVVRAAAGIPHKFQDQKVNPVKVTMSLTPGPNISRILRKGRSTNFKLGIHGWSTVTSEVTAYTCIIDTRNDLQDESSGWQFKSPFAEKREHIVAAASHYEPHRLLKSVACCIYIVCCCRETKIPITR